jgi:hypothetical protein
VVDLRTRTVHLVTPEAAVAGRQARRSLPGPVRSDVPLRLADGEPIELARLPARPEQICPACAKGAPR